MQFGKTEQVLPMVVSLLLSSVTCSVLKTPKLDTNCEIVWCKMNIIGCRTLYLGSFYRPPDKIDDDYLEEFNSSLSQIMSNGNAHVLVGEILIAVI